MECIKAHQHVMTRNVPGIEDVEMASSDVIASAVLQMLGDSPEAASGTSAPSVTSKTQNIIAAELELASFVQNRDFIMRMSEYLHGNRPLIHLKFHPTFQVVVQDVAAELGTGKKITILEALDHISKALLTNMPNKMVVFLRTLFLAMRSLQDELFSIADLTGGLFEDVAAAERTFRLRTLYVFELLDALNASALIEGDISSRLRQFQDSR